MNLEDVLKLEVTLTETNPEKKWIVQFKQDLTQLQFERVRKILDEQFEERGFGKFAIIGREVKLIEG